MEKGYCLGEKNTTSLGYLFWHGSQIGNRCQTDISLAIICFSRTDVRTCLKWFDIFIIKYYDLSFFDGKCTCTMLRRDMTHILWAWLKQNESKRKQKIAYKMSCQHHVPFEFYSDNQY